VSFSYVAKVNFDFLEHGVWLAQNYKKCECDWAVEEWD